MLLAAGCATQQPPVIQPVIQPPVIQQPPVSQQAPVNQQPSGLSDTPKSQIKDRGRDLSECERESAFAGAGDKRQIFDKCMKARGY
jgi:hypothetical protein